MKKINLILVIMIVGFFSLVEINAQPYYYFHYRDKSEAQTVLLKPAFWNFNKKEISYLSVPNEIELPNNNMALDLRWDPTQKWLTCHEPFVLFDIANKTKFMDLPDADDNTKIDELIYSPRQNKLFVEYLFDGNKYRYDSERYMYIINVTNKSVIAKINKVSSEGGYENEPMFLSRDENTLYFYVEDTLAYHSRQQYNSDSLCYFSTSTNTIISKKPISQFGYPNAYSYSIENGHEGKGIVVSAVQNSSSDKNDLYFRIYDFDNDIGSNFIRVQGYPTPYFTNEGKFLILSTNGDYEHGASEPDGYFRIYEVATGQLLKTVTLPPRGRIFTFKDFPNKLYYFLYNYQTQQGSSYTIDVDSLVNQSVGNKVKLINSSGSKLTGGSLQYYEGSWKDAVNNNDGTFTVPTTLKTVSLRMNYAYGSQTKNNVTVGADTIVFQTTNVQVKLQSSSGAAIDAGKVQYYSGAWRDLGATSNGVATKELLPGSYSFRMNFSFASSDKAQDISTNNVVVFQTIPATVQLKNSLGNLIDQGTVQYYSGAWRDFGVTNNGVVIRELLPNSYSFRMTHEFISIDKTQNVGTSNVVLFNTVLARVSVTDNLNQLVNNAMVSYYSGAWRQIGNTASGVITKELLPVSLSFRGVFGTKQTDKTQNIGTNNNIEIKLP